MHDRLIDELGGPKKVADEINNLVPGARLRGPAVSMWRTRRIPWRYRNHIKKLARRMGKEHFVPDDFLMR